MKVILAVALGGAIGAVGRHLVSSQVSHFFGVGFPIGTLVVNVVGSFAMGALIGCMMLFWSPPQEVRAFLTVGLLGAFTTFSTFSMEVLLLYERGALGLLVLYVTLSVVLCVAGVFAGLSLIRAVAA